MSNYWDTYWRRRRASRRHFLAGAGSVTAGAAGLALVGCGGDDDDDDDDVQIATNTPDAGATPTTAPADPFADAIPGGTWLSDAAGGPPTIDPYGNLSFLTKGYSNYFYSRLFKLNSGFGVGIDALVPEPDLADSFEATPDGLTYTVTLKDATFHDIAPVSGRAVDTQDIEYSWGRATAAENTNASQLAYVASVDFPDAKTAVFTLNTPNAAFIDNLADTNLLYIMPREADGGFDPSSTSIGSGPWILDHYTPDVGWAGVKNPLWHLGDGGRFPLVDRAEVAIVPEYATRLAQFLAGATDATGLTADDLVSTKNQLTDIQLYSEVPPLLSFFFFSGGDPSAPWAQPGVRRAISMAMDRDTITDTFYKVTELRDAGLDVQAPWNNLIPAGMKKFWLDPQSADQGESASLFQYNVEAAKAELAAAGYPDGFDAKYQYTENRYGSTFNSIAEVNIQFLEAIGIRVTTEVQDYSSVYITNTFVGNFEGIAFGYETPFPEGGSYPIRFFTDNPINHGKVADAELTALAQQQQQELDLETRKELFREIQRKNAENMYYVPHQAGSASGWTGYRGRVHNVLDIRTIGYGAATETLPYYWKDA